MTSVLAQSAALDQVLLYALPLGGSTLLAYGVFQAVSDLRRKEEKKVEARLRERGAFGAVAEAEKLAQESILRNRQTANSAITRWLARFKLVPALQRSLDQANLPWVASTVLVNLVAAASLTYLALHFLKFGPGISIGAAFAALLLPVLFVRIKCGMRMNKFLNQLPDVFDLLCQSLRAGHSLSSAIHLVAQQIPDPVGTEFARVFYEQNLGIKLEETLLGLADRIALLDVRLFVTAVLIQRSTGGDLAEILDNISSVIRERIKLFGTVRALSAEGRLSGYVLFALPFFLFGLEQLINPEYGRILIDEPVGHYMLGAAFIMQMLGLALIKKIVNIKV